MKITIKFLLFCFLLIILSPANAQGLLKKIKQKADQVAGKIIEKKVDKAVEDKTGVNPGDQSNSTAGPGSPSGSSRKNNPVNKGGAGLITTPPDINQNLTESETAFKANNYGEARYALQQAMLGVEMEIGKKILVELPETVVGLKFTKEDDKVTSTGWGWVGLTIQREYVEGDKQLSITIANNSLWMSAINLYMTSGYTQTSSDQNWKQTKLKGNKAIIEYEERSGYKLTVPIGQSSLIIWEGVNFATEQEIMDAANSFDIDGIKKTLGEK